MKPVKRPILPGAVLAVAAAPLVAGCAPSPSPAGGAQPEASCAYVVEYGGRSYLGGEETEVPVGEPLGTATLPACDDTPNDGGDGQGPVSVTAFTVRGVDPAVAVAVAEDAGTYRLVVADSDQKLPPELRKLLDGP